VWHRWTYRRRPIAEEKRTQGQRRGRSAVVVGGIIPPQDARALKDAGVAQVYTPKDFALNRIMARSGPHRRSRRPSNVRPAASARNAKITQN
jgi:hypothetical protein